MVMVVSAILAPTGISGDGQWFDGDANLWLGPTTAGAAIVCFPDPYDYGDVLLKIEEKIGPGLWVQLWSGPNSYSGIAMGIFFTGYTLRNVRVLIRNNEDSEGDPFFWGGSY